MGENQQKEQMGATDVLKKFFGATTEEIRGLTAGDRFEMAREAAKQMGVELIE